MKVFYIIKFIHFKRTVRLSHTLVKILERSCVGPSTGADRAIATGVWSRPCVAGGT